jgi:hypothetical protein
MKRLVVSLAVLMLCLGTLAGAVDAGEKVVLPRYPDLKVGFTTWNFSKQMPVNLANAKKWVDFAAEQGFAWMELRDPGAVLTLAECKRDCGLCQAARCRNHLCRHGRPAGSELLGGVFARGC